MKMYQIQGLISYYHLTDWWISEFKENERIHIIDNYRPMGGSGESLIKGNFEYSNHSAVKFLYLLSGYFHNNRDRAIAIRILNKAEDLINAKTKVMDLHFFYQHIIQIHYRNRDIDPKSYKKAIEGCEKQIEIAPKIVRIFKKESSDGFMPMHVGYKQLAIIREKEMKFKEVIEICTKAKSESWRGDWQKRIDHCTYKLLKTELYI